MESKILEFWKEKRIFERSVEERPKDNVYSFYDGPPFITGSPHYGSILPSIAKDVIPRYQTMKGKRVRRVWGWDCHGLPAETKVEKKLGLKNKKDIEALGVGKFIAACREYVNEVSAEWRWYIDHIGRWADMDHAYRTMDLDYMETVIWIFKSLYDKGLIYRGMRSSLYCTRCATPLSKFEITMDEGFYRDVTDPAITIKFKVKNQPDTYILAWTTTPWTLPGNAALAVLDEAVYVKIKTDNETLILAKQALERQKYATKWQIIEELKGKDLVGLEYEPLYNFLKKGPNDYKVYAANFVTMEDGTGVVHVAPAFGEVDFELGKERKLSVFMTIDEEGKFIKEITPWAGMYLKKADPLIVEDLKNRNLLLSEEKITHSYPFCYRCETPLIYKGQDAWFLNIEAIRQKLIEKNQNINWIPEHFKFGRFEYNLKSAPDWCLSRSRYWASPIPAWECESCKKVHIVGSIQEIEKRSGQKVKDLHRPDIDEITFPCESCGNKAKRVTEVLDCWFESGAMPYAERHYPFENQEEFEKNFPADFIVEYTGQLRGWFYYLHVLGIGLKESHVFKNVIATGVMKGNDGRKMSKSFGNYPDPKAVLEKYGGETLRLYFMSNPIMVGEDMNVNEEDMREHYRKTLLILWNSYQYFLTYAELHNWTPSSESKQSENVLDKWIQGQLERSIYTFVEGIEAYDYPKAVRVVRPFVEDLSTWYIRRSRERFVKGETEALQTLYDILVRFAKTMAPILPFTAEAIYQNLVRNVERETPESVHLAEYPRVNEKIIAETHILKNRMIRVKNITTLGHSIRKEKQIPVRQALKELKVNGADELKDEQDLLDLINEELNVKKTTFAVIATDKNEFVALEGNGIKVALDTSVTDELKKEGLIREIIRTIQDFRKKQGLKVGEKASVAWYASNDTKKIIADHQIDIKEVTHLKELNLSETKDNLIEVIPHMLWLGLKK